MYLTSPALCGHVRFRIDIDAGVVDGRMFDYVLNRLNHEFFFYRHSDLFIQHVIQPIVHQVYDHVPGIRIDHVDGQERIDCCGFGHRYF